MTIRKLAVFGVGAVLSGCASMGSPPSEQAASVQSAVYAPANDLNGATKISTGANINTATTSAVAAKVEKAQGESRPLRIFWFFGDR